MSMSMRGSGIYSVDVQYDEFTCEECGKLNKAGDTSTDDWGNYSVECESCGTTYYESSIQEDNEAIEAQAYEDYLQDERF